MKKTDIAKTYIGAFPIPVELGGNTFTHFEVRRFSSKERIEFNQKINVKGITNQAVIRLNLTLQLVKVGIVDLVTNSWDDDVMLTEITKTFLDELDSLNEDEVYSACVGVSQGYGNQEEWEASEEYSKIFRPPTATDNA